MAHSRMVAVMELVASRDSTPIAFERTGSGPPLVLVHGTTADHTRWSKVLPSLEQHFTVFAMDRRGRGQSGDAEAYVLEREFEDVVAVAEAVGEPVYLLGHSYGGLCAMEATLRTSRVSRLVLYEPAFSVGDAIYPQGSRDKFQRLLDQGNREGLLVAFFRDVVGMSETEIAALRGEESWAARVKAAHTLVREMADEDYRFDARRFAALTIPTLLLVGETSPAFLRNSSRHLAAALPHVETVEMAGQGHVAISTAPQLFAAEVIAFLTR